MVGIVFEYEKGRDGVVMSYSCAAHIDLILRVCEQQK